MTNGCHATDGYMMPITNGCIKTVRCNHFCNRKAVCIRGLQFEDNRGLYCICGLQFSTTGGCIARTTRGCIASVGCIQNTTVGCFASGGCIQNTTEGCIASGGCNSRTTVGCFASGGCNSRTTEGCIASGGCSFKQRSRNQVTLRSLILASWESLRDLGLRGYLGLPPKPAWGPVPRPPLRFAAV